MRASSGSLHAGVQDNKGKAQHTTLHHNVPRRAAARDYTPMHAFCSGSLAMCTRVDADAQPACLSAGNKPSPRQEQLPTDKLWHTHTRPTAAAAHLSRCLMAYCTASPAASDSAYGHCCCASGLPAGMCLSTRSKASCANLQDVASDTNKAPDTLQVVCKVVLIQRTQCSRLQANLVMRVTHHHPSCVRLLLRVR